MASLVSLDKSHLWNDFVGEMHPFPWESLIALMQRGWWQWRQSGFTTGNLTASLACPQPQNHKLETLNPKVFSLTEDSGVGGELEALG